MNYNIKTLMLELDSYVQSNEIHKHTKRITQIIKSLPQNIAEQVKQAFVYDCGWLFVGADFASLEDKISALTTKDPEKLKIYTGYAVFKVTVNGTCHHIREDAIVSFDGKQYTGKEFYELYKNS